MSSFQDRIKGIRLTKTEKKIADYILENENAIGMETAVKIADRLNITDTSVHRFLRRIGYSGFPEFKEEMNQRLLKKYENSWIDLSPGEKYFHSSEAIKNEDIVSQVISKSMDNIRKSVDRIEPKIFEDAADCLLRAQQKYVVGFRGTSAIAEYMYRKMSVFLPNVHPFTLADSRVFEQIIDITKKDALLMYSFPRYSAINTSILEIAKDKGAKIILFTDKLTSPLASYADYLISVEIEGAGHTNSYVAPMCLSEILILLMSNKQSKKNKRRINQLDFYINKHEIY
jgi:DNA-binding MurR/RpiR family transcriptional regulator